MRVFTVNANDAGQRLDKFVMKTTAGMPKSLLYKFIRTKKIKLNGSRAHENDILSEHDEIKMFIPEEFFEDSEENTDYSKIKTRPEIIYEDKNILLCNKKPGILVHLGDEGDNNLASADEKETLIFALTAYLVNRGEYSPQEENSFAPALCNRIDRNTGGIVILAKNAQALRSMNEAIRENRVHKRYLCAVHGRLEGKKTLKAYHSKNYKTNTVKIFDTQLPGAKEIITEYKSLDYNKRLDLTLLEVTLVTGRTHQIRAHMAHIGHPLLGEGKYYHNADDRRLGFTHQALYSCAVDFSLDGELSYLNGKTYSVSEAGIDFLKLFPDFRMDRVFG